MYTGQGFFLGVCTQLYTTQNIFPERCTVLYTLRIIFFESCTPQLLSSLYTAQNIFPKRCTVLYTTQIIFFEGCTNLFGFAKKGMTGRLKQQRIPLLVVIQRKTPGIKKRLGLMPVWRKAGENQSPPEAVSSIEYYQIFLQKVLRI